VAEAVRAGAEDAVRSFAAQVLHYFQREDAGVCRTPLDVPAAWRGEALRRAPEGWTEILDPAEVEELEAAIRQVRQRGLPLRRVHRQDFPLPGLAARLAGFAREVDEGRGFLLLRGLPVERWGEEDAALAFWGIGQHLGQPGAQNPEGDLLGHVRDTGEEATNPHVRRYKTSGDIRFHCDLADAVGLLCLRGARRGGASRLASSVTVYNEILCRRPDLVDRLYEPFALDSRNEQGEARRPWLPVPPCRYAHGRLSVFYHSDYFRSAERHPDVVLAPRDRELLDLFEAIANEPEIRLDMQFEPGDVQLVSNHTVVHARTAYEDPPAAGRGRHLLRLWLSLARPARGA